MTDNGVIKRSIAKKYGRGKVLIETLCHFESKKKKKKNTKWFGHKIQFKDHIFRYFSMIFACK